MLQKGFIVVGADVEDGKATVITANVKEGITTIEKVERLDTNLPDGGYVSQMSKPEDYPQTQRPMR